MKQVPAEILNEIFSNLHQNDQLRCMSVCHYWKQVMEQFILYQTIYIYSTENLDDLITKIQETPNIAHKVERVFIQIYEPLNNNLNVLLSLLKNVRSITRSQFSKAERGVYSKENFSFRDCIEYVADTSFTSITYHLLASGVCPKLTTLKTFVTSNSILRLLKNTPSLRSLSLVSGSFSFAEFDLLHENAPNLCTIEFNHVSILGDRLEWNNSLATSVKKCIFLNVDATTSACRTNFMEYVHRKYPNVIKFNRRFTCNFFGTSGDSNLVNNTTWIPLLNNAKHRLKTLGFLQGEHSSDVVSELDQHGYQLDDLKLDCFNTSSFQNMMNSKQIYSIQTLELHGDNFDSLLWLKGLPVLKDLTLAFNSTSHSYTRFDMDHLVCNCPSSLISVSLLYFTLTISSVYDNPVSNITSLSISNAHLPNGIDTFISTYFPKLLYLSMMRCSVFENIFNLSNNNLNRFCLHNFFFGTSAVGTLFVSTVSNKEGRSYSSKAPYFYEPNLKEADLFFPSPESFPGYEINTTPQFTLVCNSLKEVVITVTRLKTY